MACVDILVITYNNPNYLIPCIQSLGQMITLDIARVIVVNNGEPGSVNIPVQGVEVIDAGSNLGWEGGLKLGLEHSKSEFVCFLNDDVFFPISESLWLNRLLQHFIDPKVVAVGPSCNAIMGVQNIWANVPSVVMEVRFLIGLCYLVRRSALDACGGVDDSLPGGDDIDLSIRLRKNGGKLICDKSVFVYHHYGTTGKRVHADWDGIAHQEAYRKALWEKHTLKEYLLTTCHQIVEGQAGVVEDKEGELAKSYVKGEKIYDIGCGDKKTVDEAIGVDIVPHGTAMGGMTNRFSKADVVANVFGELPFNDADTIICRHVLEHTHDPIKAMQLWKKAVKPHGGRIIVAVPDEEKGRMIPLNPEHRASFTKDSLKRLAELIGLKTISIEDTGNNLSLMGVFERNGD